MSRIFIPLALPNQPASHVQIVSCNDHNNNYQVPDRQVLYLDKVFNSWSSLTQIELREPIATMFRINQMANETVQGSSANLAFLLAIAERYSTAWPLKDYDIWATGAFEQNNLHEVTAFPAKLERFLSCSKNNDNLSILFCHQSHGEIVLQDRYKNLADVVQNFGSCWRLKSKPKKPIIVLLPTNGLRPLLQWLGVLRKPFCCHLCRCCIIPISLILILLTSTLFFIDLDDDRAEDEKNLDENAIVEKLIVVIKTGNSDEAGSDGGFSLYFEGADLLLQLPNDTSKDEYEKSDVNSYNNFPPIMKTLKEIKSGPIYIRRDQKCHKKQNICTENNDHCRSYSKKLNLPISELCLKSDKQTVKSANWQCEKIEIYYETEGKNKILLDAKCDWLPTATGKDSMLIWSP